MSTLVISGTIGIVILMWLLMRPDDVKKLADSISKLYTSSVGALVPKS